MVFLVIMASVVHVAHGLAYLEFDRFGRFWPGGMVVQPDHQTVIGSDFRFESRGLGPRLTPDR